MGESENDMVNDEDFNFLYVATSLCSNKSAINVTTGLDNNILDAVFDLGFKKTTRIQNSKKHLTIILI